MPHSLLNACCAATRSGPWARRAAALRLDARRPAEGAAARARRASRHHRCWAAARGAPRAQGQREVQARRARHALTCPAPALDRSHPPKRGRGRQPIPAKPPPAQLGLDFRFGGGRGFWVPPKKSHQWWLFWRAARPLGGCCDATQHCGMPYLCKSCGARGAEPAGGGRGLGPRARVEPGPARHAVAPSHTPSPRAPVRPPASRWQAPRLHAANSYWRCGNEGAAAGAARSGRPRLDAGGRAGTKSEANFE